MEALEMLRSKLIGSFISRFSTGDTWDLYIGGYWLTAHDIISEDEKVLDTLFKDNYIYFESTVDKECISKSAIVAAAMRREIISVELDNLGNLKIEFGNNFKLTLPTNVGIVDWQWCLNETGVDPYQNYLVACFSEGKIQVNEK
ncbi:hypothetical protein [Hymenobacter bucti]|uniref:Uncharacterized protein n=1 Tax=Hymenobacter bucti TaxID=1844114 RepID=A0ABW4QXM9_9BACT